MASPGSGRSPRRSCGYGPFRIRVGILPFRISEQALRRRTAMKRTAFAVAALSVAAAGFSLSASAQNEQFIPASFYWVGPYAPGGSGFGGGIIDRSEEHTSELQSH